MTLGSSGFAMRTPSHTRRGRRRKPSWESRQTQNTLQEPNTQYAVLPTTAENWFGCSCERQRAGRTTSDPLAGARGHTTSVVSSETAGRRPAPRVRSTEVGAARLRPYGIHRHRSIGGEATEGMENVRGRPSVPPSSSLRLSARKSRVYLSLWRAVRRHRHGPTGWPGRRRALHASAFLAWMAVRQRSREATAQQVFTVIVRFPPRHFAARRRLLCLLDTAAK